MSDQFQIEWWPIDRPIPYARNARRLSSSAIDKVAASIKEFGWRQPIVVDKEGVIAIGHTRLKAAQKLGMAEVPVHVADNLTPGQVKALRLADNRTNQESSWDEALLGPEITDLQSLDIDLSLTAFDPREIDRLLAGESAEDEEAETPPLPEVPITMAGDLWLLGEHRVLCGDSTSIDAVQKLCGETKADLVFTDPPYNVDYEGYTEEKLKLSGDKMDAAAFGQFLRDIFTSYFMAVKQTASMYVCHPSSWQREFQDAIEAAGFKIRTQIIWAKNTFAWGFARYKFQHEPMFYCHVDGETDEWYGDKSQSTLWQCNKPAANRLHPTMKPVELAEMAIANSSKAGNIVLDLFGGSGSTLIAAHKTRRKSQLMELDPKYVDVIVKRWQEYTGKAATLEGDGRTFAEIEQERTGQAVAA